MTHERVVFPERELLQDQLCSLILRVRFTSEDELHGAFLVVHQTQQTMRVCKEQAPTLVSGDAARETYSQRIGVKHCARGFGVVHALVVAEAFLECAIADE